VPIREEGGRNLWIDPQVSRRSAPAFTCGHPLGD
jgi:hypothetical protein